MGVMDDFLVKAKEVADIAGKKTNEVVEFSKVKIQISQTSNEIRDLYARLGEAAYHARRRGTEDSVETAQLCEEIDAANKKLIQLQQKLMELKKQRICPKCGEKNSREAAYCMSCGTRLYDFGSGAHTGSGPREDQEETEDTVFDEIEKTFEDQSL